MRLTYRMKGMSKFMRQVRKKPQRLKIAVDQEMSRSSLRVEREAKMLAPWDTGWMSTNIYSNKMADLMYEVVSPAEYSIYVERGTRHQAAQPFFFIALENEFPKLMRNLNKIVKG